MSTQTVPYSVGVSSDKAKCVLYLNGETDMPVLTLTMGAEDLDDLIDALTQARASMLPETTRVSVRGDTLRLTLPLPTGGDMTVSMPIDSKPDLLTVVLASYKSLYEV